MTEQKKMPTVTIIHAPTREEWADIAGCIWIGALEGGSNHWIEGIHTNGNDLKSGYEIVDKNFEVVIHVEDYEPVRWYRNAFDVILDGITLLDGKRQVQVFEDIGQLDAYDYDLIIQLGVFGKEVFC
jgi:hypothetical protein